MLVNLPYAYDDLFLPRMGSLTFAGRPCSTPAGGGGGGMLPLVVFLHIPLYFHFISKDTFYPVSF